MQTNVGFIGTGIMGEPMATNLVQAGKTVVAWNRTRSKVERLEAEGVSVASSPKDVFARAEIVILMLRDGAAIDEVLQRGSAGFARMIDGRTVVQMGTVAPNYSRALEADIIATGGRYVESPVSGSRKPAEDRRLVAMMAGVDRDVEDARPLVETMCRTTVNCGSVPNALLMKLAVNSFMIATVTGLVEAFHVAGHFGLDTSVLAEVLDAGPIASPISTEKLRKMLRSDFSVQAAIADVLMNARLIVDEARLAGAAAPLGAVCRDLYSETLSLGHGASDIVAVIRALEARCAAAAI